MHLPLLGLLLLMPGAAAAQESASTPRDIVVTGRPLSQTERALAACLSRHCPPKEDIAATLAHAENQFVAGDYSGARKTLLASRARNKRFGAQYPIEVGDLLRANARLASLNGRENEAKIGQIESFEALKLGLPSNDPRVLMQRLEIGGAQVARGQIDMGARVYRTVADQARAAHLPIVEGIALLRRAVLYGALADFFPVYRPTAKAAIKDVLALPSPEAASFRQGAVLLRAQLAAKDGQSSELDAAYAQFRDLPTERPVLLYSPAIDLEQAQSRGSGVVKLVGRDKAQWADVTYWITPAGTVRDVDVLRQSDASAAWWLGKVTAAIQKRRYAPLKVPTGSAGALRVERYSMVYPVAPDRTETRLSLRDAVGRLESTDLTVEQPTTPG